MSAKILLIDDDIELCKIIDLALTKTGLQVDVSHDAVSGIQKAYAIRPDVILLDVMMPGMDGWQACERFREMTDTPIIFLSALGSQDEVVKGLTIGADDYIVKPVSTQELSARINAVMRRASQSSANTSTSTPMMQYKNLTIDFDKYEVKMNGARIDLSPTEFRLLNVLAKYKGRVLPHEFLLTEVWGADYIGEIDYLRLYISYLRKKLEVNGEEERFIHNEWGVGYRFGD